MNPREFEKISGYFEDIRYKFLDFLKYYSEEDMTPEKNLNIKQHLEIIEKRRKNIDDRLDIISSGCKTVKNVIEYTLIYPPDLTPFSSHDFYKVDNIEIK